MSSPYLTQYSSFRAFTLSDTERVTVGGTLYNMPYYNI